MRRLVVFSEFGAANLFYPWFKKQELNEITFSMPQSIFSKLEESFQQSKYFDLTESSIDFEDFEQFYVAPTRINNYSEIYRFAKSRGKETYGLLDNWIFFEDRIRNIYPDKIIVTDEWALERARTCFRGKSNIELIENFYLSEIKLKLKLKPGNRNKIVYIHALSDIHFEIESGIHGIQCICKDIFGLKLQYPNDEIVIRLHPSLKEIPCILTSFFQQNILDEKFSVSDDCPLGEDLLNAKLCVGIPSYALYVSSQCGITTMQTRKTNRNWFGPKFDHFDLT
jgi:hypothetical protein